MASNNSSFDRTVRALRAADPSLSLMEARRQVRAVSNAMAGPTPVPLTAEAYLSALSFTPADFGPKAITERWERKDPVTLPLGTRKDGSLVAPVLTSLSVVGRTGAGKTSLLRSLSLSLLLCHGPEQVAVVGCAPSDPLYAMDNRGNSVGALTEVSADLGDFRISNRLASTIFSEIDLRMNLIQHHQVTSYTELPASEKVPALVLILEGLGSLSEPLENAIEAAFRLGRSLGVFPVFGSQVPRRVIPLYPHFPATEVYVSHMVEGGVFGAACQTTGHEGPVPPEDQLHPLYCSPQDHVALLDLLPERPSARVSPAWGRLARMGRW